MNRATGSLRGTVESGQPSTGSCRAGTLTNSFPLMGTVPRPPSCCHHGLLTEVAATCTSVSRNLTRHTDDDDDDVAAFRHHSRLRRAPGSAACCIRKDRRQLPRKVQGRCYPPEDKAAIHTSCNLFLLTVFPLWCAAQQRVGVCGETKVLLPWSMPEMVN